MSSTYKETCANCGHPREEHIPEEGSLYCPLVREALVDDQGDLQSVDFDRCVLPHDQDGPRHDGACINHRGQVFDDETGKWLPNKR